MAPLPVTFLSDVDCTTVPTNYTDTCEYLIATLNNTQYPNNFMCAPNQYFNGATCVNYNDIVQKVAGLQDFGATTALIDTGNTAWMLSATALVMIMTPGVGFFYAGLAGEESAANTILMSFATMCIVTVQWFLFGYSFAFGPGTSGFGSFQWGAFTHVYGNPSAVYGFNIPHTLYAAFQCQFAQITPALISGAVIGRMKFTSYCIFVFIWTTVIYDPIAHWVWSLTLSPDYTTIVPLGWLGKLGAIDFAGGTVIHVSSGSAALAAAIVLGPRKYKKNVKPHDAPMVVLGGTLLWFGWFGFNAGSYGGAGGVASMAFWNTHLATSMASLSWMVCEAIVDGAPTPMGAAAGAVAGLVAITPGCGFVNSWAALIFGIVVSPFCYAAAKLKAKIGPDDTLDSFAVHAVGGAVGAFCTGLFATTTVNTVNGAFFGVPMQLGYQMAAICTSGAFSFFGTVLILLLLKVTIGIRITDEAESEGIDASEHGHNAYHNDLPPSATRIDAAVSVSGNPKYQG